ncbi:cobalamin biosynthesis protein [Pseudonocardia sp. RS11V-5]|uniref:cobalamin biosynthesis protein n=1 Tax=Pseudonocardia terrae TaxID=2905831 RepID=UPI001E6502BF|nr:cobalamin biosynthesis protein [Pseudonocardia terrae]MCE3552084.1 cobalamin biosynthesis protein [Pseudonocardia terrae]
MRRGLLHRFPGSDRACGLALGVAADLVLADPRRGHPVAGFGRLAAGLERRLYADSRRAGVAYTAALVGGAVATGVVGERLAGRGSRVLLTAVATWAVLGGTSLVREGAALGRSLEQGDLEAARARIPHLCARDPALLDAAGMARAGVESLAENTSDAVVAPLFWGAVAGVPGLLGYRAINTLDAMVGYRSPRYTRFGWASARLDDLVNLAPARLAAVLTAVAAPLVGGRPCAAVAAWRRDAREHPSPNAGPVEAAAAGALGVRLGGRTEYSYGAEDRPSLGHGPAPVPADLVRAARLSRAVGLLAAGVGAAVALLRPPPRWP